MEEILKLVFIVNIVLATFHKMEDWRITSFKDCTAYHYQNIKQIRSDIKIDN